MIPIYVRYGNQASTVVPAKKFSNIPNCSNQAIKPSVKRLNPLLKLIHGETAVESNYTFLLLEFIQLTKN